MVKIAYVVSTFPPYHGGMGNVTFAQAKELVRRGHDVTVFTPQYGRESLDETIKGVRVVRLVSLIRKGNAAFVPQLLWRLRGFDIIHFHAPFFGAGLFVALYRLFHRHAKLVVQYHMDVIGKGAWRIFFFLYMRCIMPVILSIADSIVVSSFDYAHASILQKWFEKFHHKTKDIMLGVDMQRFASHPDTLRESVAIPATAFTFLFVGGLDQAHYFKGVDVLLRAFARAQELSHEKPHLIIVGEGNLRSEYERIARDLHSDSCVHFVGRVSDEDLPLWYAASDIFVLPSVDTSEAFGLVLLEAMSAQKPVIASDLPGVRSVVDNNVTGFLVRPNNVQALAERMGWCAKNHDQLLIMGQAGYKKVQTQYQWSRVVDTWEQLYTKCLHKSL